MSDAGSKNDAIDPDRTLVLFQFRYTFQDVFSIRYGERMQFVAERIAAFANSPLAALTEKTPWALPTNSALSVRRLLSEISEEYRVSGNVAIHRTATVEARALVKAPAIYGPMYS